MRNSVKTAVHWALKLACSGVVSIGGMSWIAGCNKMESPVRQADRSVDESLAKSLTDHDLGGEKGAKASYEDLKHAAGETGASASAKVRAKGDLARDEFNRGVAQLPEIDRRALAIEQALWDVRQAGVQVQNALGIGSGYSKLDPKEVMAKADEDRAMIQKNIEKAKADEQTAQMELDKRKAEIDALKQERMKADADAESLADKSSVAKGEESVKLFADASEARSKAGTLAAQMEMKSASLAPLERTVARAKQQQLLWDSPNKESLGALQELDEHKQQVDARWQDTQAQATAMGETAKKIVASTIAPVKSGDKPGDKDNAGQRLVQLVKANEEQRDAVAKLLNDSVKHFGEAIASAKQFRTDAQARVSAAKDPASPELATWKSLMSLYDENQYLLHQGAAQNALGDLFASDVVELQHRKHTMDDLSKILQAGGLTLPSDLPAADPVKSSEEAIKWYKEAEKTLQPATDVTRNTEDIQVVKNSALVALLHAHMGRYRLTHDEDSKTAFKTDQLRAKDALIELPATLRAVPE